MSDNSRHIGFTRAARIAGYNWPLYAAAGVGVALGVGVASLAEAPPIVRWLGGIGAAIAAWYAVASFWAFHMMFDRSDLLSGRWLTQEIPHVPARWVQINVGLEETTLPLCDVYAGTEGKSLDLYNPSVTNEPAVTRARQQKSGPPASAIEPDSLPVADGWAELVAVTLAAHEIRKTETRERFFHELRRIVALDGRIVVIEHLRDLAAALAFGPGIFHFYPRAEWLRLGRHAGLILERERPITPFVRVFVFRCP